MASKSLGTLTLDLIARTGGFVRGMSQAERESKKWRRQVSRDLKRAGQAFRQMSTVAVAATAAAAGGLALMTRAGLESIDQQAKLARQLDSSIGGLRGLQLAASDAGVDTGTLNGAMERLSARLGEAELGTGQAAEALDRIGLSARDLAAMDVDQRIATIADRVNALGLTGAQTANLLRDLGIRNTEMVNLLRQGGEAIRAATQEIEDYGLAIDGIDAQAVEAANDQLSRVGLVLESVRNSLAVELAPVILEVARRINEAARASGGFGTAIVDAVDVGVRAFAGAIEGASEFLSVIDELVLGLQYIQRLELQAQGAGITVSRLFTGPFREDDDIPESFVRLAELEADMARRRERIENGSPVADVLREYADVLREIRNQRNQRSEDPDTGIFKTLDAWMAELDGATAAVVNFGETLERFTPSIDENVQGVLDRAGPGATVDDGGLLRDAFGNALPTLQRDLEAALAEQSRNFQNQQNLAAGLNAVVQQFVDDASQAAQVGIPTMRNGMERVAQEFIDNASTVLRSAWASISPPQIQLAQAAGTSSGEQGDGFGAFRLFGALNKRVADMVDGLEDSTSATEDDTTATETHTEQLEKAAGAARNFANAADSNASRGDQEPERRDTISERARERFESSSLRRGESSVINFGRSPSGLDRAASSTSAAASQPLGSLRLTNDRGDGVDVEGDRGELTKWLADTLSGAAGSVR